MTSDQASFYQTQIGVLRWCVELGRIDIIMEVSELALYLALPREGHLEAVFHLFNFLDKWHNVLHRLHKYKSYEVLLALQTPYKDQSIPQNWSCKNKACTSADMGVLKTKGTTLSHCNWSITPLLSVTTYLHTPLTESIHAKQFCIREVQNDVHKDTTYLLLPPIAIDINVIFCTPFLLCFVTGNCSQRLGVPNGPKASETVHSESQTFFRTLSFLASRQTQAENCLSLACQNWWSFEINHKRMKYLLSIAPTRIIWLGTSRSSQMFFDQHILAWRSNGICGCSFRSPTSKWHVSSICAITWNWTMGLCWMSWTCKASTLIVNSTLPGSNGHCVAECYPSLCISAFSLAWWCHSKQQTELDCHPGSFHSMPLTWWLINWSSYPSMATSLCPLLPTPIGSCLLWHHCTSQVLLYWSKEPVGYSLDCWL